MKLADITENTPSDGFFVYLDNVEVAEVFTDAEGVIDIRLHNLESCSFRDQELPKQPGPAGGYMSYGVEDIDGVKHTLLVTRETLASEEDWMPKETITNQGNKS